MQRPPEILSDLITFYQKLLIPYMKIRRDMPFPTEPGRLETDGEHAFTLAMIVISLNERLNLKLDAGKIAQYALVHDLVEAHAGDVSARAPDEQHLHKEEKEQEALKQIETDFADIFPWVHNMIHAYEKKEDKESKFVYVVDKSMGALGWLSGEGGGFAQYYPIEETDLYQKTRERLRAKVALHGDKQMLELFDYIHDTLDKKRPEYYQSSP